MVMGRGQSGTVMQRGQVKAGTDLGDAGGRSGQEKVTAGVCNA